MSMLTLNGIVQNVFRVEASVDRKTGESIPARDKVQVMAENVLQNGEKRMELVTLTVEQGEPFRKLQGKQIRLPVGVFAVGAGVQFYALKGQGIPEAVAQ